MASFDSAPRQPKSTSDTPPPELEDFKDNEELHRLLLRLPIQLRQVHMQHIADLHEDAATEYLYALHERRGEALRESVVNDENLRSYFDSHKEQIFKALETTLFADEESVIGRGTTAKINRLDLHAMDSESSENVPEMAIKYLITPNDQTLNVAAEHDLIAEVEQLRKIEFAESAAGADKFHIRVPHPYFYHRKGKIQCYGMELIDGINLDAVGSTVRNIDLKEELKETLKDIDQGALMQEIDLFFDTMHTICLHGDVKRGNMMVSRDGHFYVIDFGQSKLMTSVSDTHVETLEVAKEGEKRVAKKCVHDFLKELYET
jgi:tRNA A-37 threonylcarbamoyl transferase component Bud32